MDTVLRRKLIMKLSTKKLLLSGVAVLTMAAISACGSTQTSETTAGSKADITTEAVTTEAVTTEAVTTAPAETKKDEAKKDESKKEDTTKEDVTVADSKKDESKNEVAPAAETKAGESKSKTVAPDAKEDKPAAETKKTSN